MKYLHLNADCRNGNSEPIVMKASERAYEICGRMGELVRKHRELEKKLLDEMAKINNMSTDEVSDTMCKYDFMVDSAQYATGAELFKEITEQEYYTLLRKAIEEGTMEFNSEFVEKIKRIDRKQKMHALHNTGKLRRKHD